MASLCARAAAGVVMAALANACELSAVMAAESGGGALAAPPPPVDEVMASSPGPRSSGEARGESASGALEAALAERAAAGVVMAALADACKLSVAAAREQRGGAVEAPPPPACEVMASPPATAVSVMPEAGVGAASGVMASLCARAAAGVVMAALANACELSAVMAAESGGGALSAPPPPVDEAMASAPGPRSSGEACGESASGAVEAALAERAAAGVVMAALAGARELSMAAAMERSGGALAAPSPSVGELMNSSPKLDAVAEEALGARAFTEVLALVRRHGRACEARAQAGAASRLSSSGAHAGTHSRGATRRSAAARAAWWLVLFSACTRVARTASSGHESSVALGSSTGDDARVADMVDEVFGRGVRVYPVDERRSEEAGSHIARADDDEADLECSLCFDDEVVPGAVGSEEEVEAPGRRRLGPLDPVRARVGGLSGKRMVAEARFLQHFWRRMQATKAATGRTESLGGRGEWRRYTPFYRPCAKPRCQAAGGIASDAEFEEQAERAQSVIMWYDQYVRVLEKLTGRPAAAVSGFCGGGGSDEGIRRSGGVSEGIDAVAQPDFVRHFGGHFHLGDATDLSVWRRAGKANGAFVWGSSPPCKWYSTGRTGEPSQPPLIQETRDLLRRGGKLWWIENVLGASQYMDADAVILRGTHFGLHVDRGRKFETNFRVHLDAALRMGDQLRTRTCLGGRRRWLRVDPFGRPVREVCCRGNLFAVQGAAPTRSSASENAVAMGVDPHHMPWSRLAQAIPPAYTQLLFGQAAMHEAHGRYGVPMITHDQMVARPEWARNELRKWLRGAGAAAASAGMSFEPLPAGAAWDSAAARASRVDRWVASEEQSRPGVAKAARPATGAGPACWSSGDWSLAEVDFREVYYSRHGGFGRSVVGAESARWLDAFVTPGAGSQGGDRWSGCNTFVHVPVEQLDSMEAEIFEAIAGGGGTRVSAVLPAASSALDGGRVERWTRAGFVLTTDLGERTVLRGVGDAAVAVRPPSRMVVMSAGRRHAVPPKLQLDRSALLEYMDPIDSGLVPKEASDRKLERAWEPIAVDAKKWRGKGLPEEVVKMMTEGVEVEGPEVASFYEIPQYPFGDTEHAMRGGEEADRALHVGAMEYVPEEMVEELMKDCIVHPWLVVHQGPEKWRACQDYKLGTNLFNDSPPFDLPSAWSVRPVLTPDSHFAKYDLRDGFWHIPIKPECRRRLLVRHPTNGRLMWASRLPFGYVRSPERFCLLTQSVADLFHRRHAGCGAHVFVFVDDYLVVGDDEEKTKWACAKLEEIFAELGLIWAPHKRRGPARVMEFLGLLICNTPVMCCMALTESREKKLKSMIDEWMELEPRDGSELEVNPTELARLLGNLVFASQVVPGGRTAMLAMLASFKGLVVDWKQGRVKPSGGAWRRMRVGTGFWLDLAWWSDHLAQRTCVPLRPEPLGEAVVGGTDASGWGYGNLVWIDGHREETSLAFTDAETRRPINWRELLGILRVVQTWGGRLEGKVLLVETDNMTACWSAKKSKAKVADMQELIRRLVDACETHGVTLRMTHTPGAKLHRPDQTSRGDAVAEPRQRLGAALFERLAGHLGPFTSFVGAERWHAQPRVEGGHAERMWVHPTHETVASALALMMGRMKDSARRSASGVILVPDAPDAAWWPLTRHLAYEGMIERESEIEENRLGAWCQTTTRRDVFLFSFPRVAGFWVEPVHMSVGINEGFEGDYSSYSLCAGADPRMRRSVEKGTILTGRSVPLEEDDDAGDWVFYMAEDAYPTGPSHLVKVTPLPIDGYVSGTQRRTARMSASAQAREARTWVPGDRLFALGGSLVKVFSREGRAGRGGSLTFEVQTEAAARLAQQAERVRGPLGTPASSPLGSVSPSAFVWGSAGASTTLGGSASGSRRSMSRPMSAMSGASAASGEVMVDIMGFSTVVDREIAAVQTGLDELSVEDAYVLPEGPTVTPVRIPEAPEPSSQDVRAAGYEPFATAGGESPEWLGDAQRQLDGHAEQAEGQRRLEEESTGDEARRCQQRTLTCAGCGEHINFGVMMTTGRRGWLHCIDSCIRADAERRPGDVPSTSLNAERAEPGECLGPAPARSTAGIVLEAKRARLESALDSDRVFDALLCMRGDCECEEEPDLMCEGACGRGLHSKCAVLGKGAQLGKMRCAFCRLNDMLASKPVSPAVEMMAAEQTLMELEALKETTARNHLSMERMQQQWLNEVLQEGGTIAKPADNASSLAAMILWLVKSGRGSTLEGFEISFSSYMKSTGRPNLFTTELVKKSMKKAKDLNPNLPQPKTAATSALAAKVLEIIPEMADTPFLAERESLMYSLEAVTGARIGEIAGAQAEHGVFANHMCSLEWVGVERAGLRVAEDGEEEEGDFTREAPPGVRVGDIFVEHDNETSKTNAGRVMCVVGKTTGPAQIELAKTLESYWRACGFDIEEKMEGGWKVRRPNFSVVQISMHAYKNQASKIKKICELVTKTTKVDKVRAMGKALVANIHLIERTTDPMASKMFMNLYGGSVREGSDGAADVAVLMAELAAIGVKSTVALGPLLMKTGGKSGTGDSVILPMPILSKSTYAFMHKITDRAFRMITQDGGDQDLILGKGRDTPHFAHHSWRRLADTVAEAKLARKECSEIDIELHFGWRLAKHKKKMRLHYSNRGARTARARLTEDI